MPVSPCLSVVKLSKYQPTGQISSAVLINVFIYQALNSSCGGPEFDSQPACNLCACAGGCVGMHTVDLRLKIKVIVTQCHVYQYQSCIFHPVSE